MANKLNQSAFGTKNRRAKRVDFSSLGKVDRKAGATKPRKVIETIQSKPN